MLVQVKVSKIARVKLLSMIYLKAQNQMPLLWLRDRLNIISNAIIVNIKIAIVIRL